MKSLVRARMALIDTFGNLTLLTRSANPKLGHKGWDQKKDLFRESLLALNRKVGSSLEWTDDIIRERSKFLGEVAAKVWRVD